MSRAALTELVTETLTTPRVAAARLIMLDLPRAVLWQALALVIALNALAFHLGVMVQPPSEPLPPMMATPFMFALMLGGGALATVFAIAHAGRWLGGEAGLSDVVVLVVWLQALRLAVQLAATVLTLLAPGLALVLLMVVNLYGLWIFVNFIDVAHRFGSPLKALGVIGLAGIGIVLGLILMLSVVGASTVGVSAHV
ncbi:YIP1 family protein [Marinovum sp.]|uniref:YIP1 family protein n=1 Tax=Marinovum sp. TaxID=2024839 RepID=UPI002B273B91|nr:YIP1 family protein [Marinovum sp.]